MSNSYSTNTNLLKKSAFLWLLIVIFLLIWLGYLIPKSKINSNVLSLLPQAQTSQVPTELIDGFQNRLDKQLVWLIKPTNQMEIEPIQWWYDNLKTLPFIQNVNGYFDQDFQKDWGQFAYQHRYQLVDEKTLNKFRSQTQLEWILSQLYSPFSGVNAQELHNDPLLLTRSSQLNQLSNVGNLTILNNWLTGKDESGHVWYMIYAELDGSSFNMNQSHQMVQQLDQLTQSLKDKWPDTKILKRGVLYYSDYASEQAKTDISMIGSLSILGIIILIIAVFRSVRPILLTILSITIGIVCGLVAVLTLFGEIHIITLVMSTSIIGIAIDYALHYLTERLLHGNQESPYHSLTKLISTLTIALCTSLIAYLILLFTPFPGLKQLSTFASFGLIGAFLSVICWYPFLVNKLPVRENVVQHLLNNWLTLWKKKSIQLTTVSFAIIFICYGITSLKIDDDIGRLQALPTHLKEQEQKIIDITKQSTDQKWFIVYGNTPEQTLQRLDKFLPLLEEIQKTGAFTQYQHINLPSIQKQQNNIEQIETYSINILTSLEQMGVDVQHPDFKQAKQQSVTPALWEKSAISQGRKLLWLSLNDELSATLVPINGITNLRVLQDLSNTEDGVYWLDRREEFNNMFADYRTHLSQLLALAITIICLSFVYRNRHYGIVIALKSTLPTLLSVGCALSTLSITNQSLNLFSLLALILVIGIGIDYSLFLSNDKNQSQSALLAVSMAALTTLLSFGLLILSHTSAIIGFGLVLASGIFTAFLFSPLAVKPKQ